MLVFAALLSLFGCASEGTQDLPATWSHCPAPPSVFSGPTCTPRQLCASNDCGPVTAFFDERGCYRKVCKTTEDCGEGQRCIQTRNEDPDGCHPTTFEGCTYENGECSCSTSSNCSGRRHCVDTPTAASP